MIHQARRCGALGLSDGSLHWGLWAPKAKRVELVLIQGTGQRAIPMQAEKRGHFGHTETNVPDGQRYAFRLDGGPPRPDPCSLWQPDGVHGPSAVVRPQRFRWTDNSWKGVPRSDLVIYELHVGTFTPEGTFEAIIPRLESLRQLGVTALELMPVAQFPGSRDWGYDGVDLYAAQNNYGGPHALARLVDACHASGLAISLDVVYNHLGPEGNYLNEFGPYFSDRYQTPWGKAVNYDSAGCDAVRDFVLDNARMWLEDFHFDGLRLDAVHAIYDMGARHILRAIKEAADDVADRSGRTIHIIAESDLNDPKLLIASNRGGYGLDAQWADDFHHSVQAYLTGETQGYYEDFGEAGQIARALASPFLYAGDYSRHRDRSHGAAPPPELTGDRFVVCIQNHDQVGNRARGERLPALLRSPAQERLAASLLLFSPYLPLLFMGQEYGEDRPFPFFCSFGDDRLRKAVAEGRKREFPHFAQGGLIPDPNDESTFVSAQLSWSWPEGGARAGLRRLYADLLAARRTWPALRDFNNRTARLFPDQAAGPVLELIRGDPGSVKTVQILFNLTGGPQPTPTNAAAQPRQLLISSEFTKYGGERPEDDTVRLLRPYECVAFS